MYKNMFRKGRIGTAEIKNRFVMPAMKSDYTTADRKVNQQVIDYYTARAKGGFGLLISEYCLVDPEGAAIPHQMSVYSDEFLPGLIRLADEVHKAGAKMFLQLHHAGRETVPDNTGGLQPVSASAVPSPIFCCIPRALSVEEIKAITGRFGDAAQRAKKAGFDGVELQMGHGYLVGQFLSPAVNKRTDEYGGSLEGRMKFGLEILRTVKERCGSEFPVSVRISGVEFVPGGTTIEESAVFARACEDAGADAVHVSAGSMASLEYLCAPTNIPNGFNLENAAVIKRAVKIPVIAVGRIVEPVMAERAVADKIADFVSMGRASIADPELPNKAAEDRTDEICPCVGCLTRCWGTPGADGSTQVGCMMNPFTGNEGSMKMDPADQPKKIVIAGAGPAGLETAWIAAARGHQVTVLEKSDHLGGQLWLASAAPGKTEFARAVKYQKTMCEKYGVDVRLSTEATAEMICGMNPDTVILATGADAPQFKLDTGDIPVIGAFDILSGKSVLGSSVLIIGAGMVGLETAEYAAAQGRKVTVAEMQDEVGNGISGAHLKFILESLEKSKTEIFTEMKVKSGSEAGIVCETPDGERILKGYDMIITAVGTRSYNPLEESLKDKIENVHVIGDAVNPGRAYAAIETGARLALSI
ncbi:MAG: FAD-dependent oxidoreductase [Muricomes sp.]|uniref:FAD-dependent oxidoreductase n=1 Tax=Faecalicatena contorta TaxID=39482 RepID=UPI002EC60F30|nr:FAD-dependent oxidoreductase [Muricomes sp.]